MARHFCSMSSGMLSLWSAHRFASLFSARSSSDLPLFCFGHFLWSVMKTLMWSTSVCKVELNAAG